MIITFCGHRDFNKGEKDYKLYELLCEIIKGESVEFYVGGYGAFDSYALSNAIEYKKNYGNAKICFITPYLNTTFSKNQHFKREADEIIYPAIEKVPKQYAILKRNEWMVKKADVVVAYVKFSWGGARKAFDYAKKLKKKVYNLA